MVQLLYMEANDKKQQLIDPFPNDYNRYATSFLSKLLLMKKKQQLKTVTKEPS